LKREETSNIEHPTLNIERRARGAVGSIGCSMFGVGCWMFSILSFMEINPSCPLPMQQYPHVLMAHGGGGKLMQQLLENVFGAAFSNPILDARHDVAQFHLPAGRLAMTTDSYVVRPLFFPGGDIGSLAIHGTVNDLAMSGARPLYLSCAFIIEEGLPMETLWCVVVSMRDAAQRCGVQIVTGDTKVVDQGKGDGLYLNTTGIGVIEHDLNITPASVQPGDAVIVSGDLGRHGMAIMAVREGLQFESAIESDSAPVREPVRALIKSGIEVHCLRDLTRGGLASALNEIAAAAGVKIAIQQKAVPVREDVHAACEMLGLDPLHVANEGRFVAFVAAQDAERTVEILRRHEVSANAVLIGKVTNHAAPLVTLRSAIGVSRILDMPSGEQLPRIC
jgi:hydrogenase expression/formation protein HypE